MPSSPGRGVIQTSPAPSPTILYDSERAALRRSGSTSYFATTPGATTSSRHRNSSSRRSSRILRPRSYTNASTDSALAPPDVQALLRSKRKWWRRLLEPPRGFQVALMCVSIVMSAIQANGVYCWPTYGPVVAKGLGLSVSESQTIVVGGILGVYLCAAPLGALVDRHGPQVGSLLAACVSSFGYLSFAAIVKAGPEAANQDTYLMLMACYFCVGAGTVTSYFAALTTASLSFPAYPTLALSFPLSLIGLSALFLSSFSSIPVFHDEEGELNAAHFIGFLGVLTAVVNLFGAAFMRVHAPVIHLDDDYSDDEAYDRAEVIEALSSSLHLDERTPLLIGGPEAALEEVEAEAQGKDVSWSAVGLMKNEGFWLFGFILSLSIGPAETTIASIGSVLTSLLDPDIPPPPPMSNAMSALSTFAQNVNPLMLAEQSALALRNKHVFILSISGTVARLATGFAADYLAPAAIALPAPANAEGDVLTHLFVQRDPVILRRSTFAALCTLALAGVFAWSAGWLDGEPMLWVTSGGVGALYGAIFTLTPAIISAHYGPRNFGLAWGMVSYFPALGSVVFSYLLATLAETAADSEDKPMPEVLEPGVCYGTACFSTTFWISAACCTVSAVGIWIMGKRWRV